MLFTLKNELSSFLNYALHLFSLLDPFVKKFIRNCYFSPQLQKRSYLIKNNKCTPLLCPLPKSPLPPRAPQSPSLTSQFLGNHKTKRFSLFSRVNEHISIKFLLRAEGFGAGHDFFQFHKMLKPFLYFGGTEVELYRSYSFNALLDKDG